MDELIALVGRSWRLLLLYPGGLTALGCVLVTRLLFEQPRGLRRGALPRLDVEIVIAATWLLAITLLPLPQSDWSYPLDLLILLLLLEMPYWIYLPRSLNRATQITALLNVYPLLALSIAALGQGAGSLVALEINRSTGLLHWAGVAGWASTLPPLLGLGPWRNQDLRGTLLALRRVGHMGLLLAVALPANDQTPIIAALLGFACIVVPLAALNRWWRGNETWWIGWQPWLVAALVLLVAWTSGQTLLLRLR
ncbi:MAG: hypothetical protein JOZ51_18290 [Chloroflexi bacterium]|nr:hypothetical protein [Chloroflexota bacterium]